MTLRERARATEEISQEMFDDGNHELWALFGTDAFFEVQERLIEERQVEITQRAYEPECMDYERGAV